jgi:peptide/nickel transport system permease protein
MSARFRLSWRAAGREAAPVLLPRWMTHAGLLIGAAVLLAMALLALFAPLLSPYDPYHQDLLARMQPPVWVEGGAWSHPLGTDDLGRDYWTRLAYGARISLLVGVTVAFISMLIGSTLGLLAGYFGGLLDTVISFLITARLAMPVILVSLAVVALYGASLGTVVAVLGLLLWDRFALVVRASTQQIRSAEFVIAARVQGASARQIIWHEIVPNVANSLVVVATLEIAHAIILEAALSFLGLGVPPPLPSWGLMISEGKANILFEPWLVTIPGLMIFALVLAVNLLGDGLRDVTSPESRN